MSARWVVWASLITAGVVYEAVEILEGPSGVPLSKVVRRVFRTDTPAGSAIFVLCAEHGSKWFIQHILQEGATTT